MAALDANALEARNVFVEAMSGIHNELSAIYERFAAIVATGHSYAESMGHVLRGIAGLWEVLAGAVDVASWLDDSYETPSRGWELLESIERGMRRCLMMSGRTIKHASMLLRVLGVMVGEAERCAVIWRSWGVEPASSKELTV